MLYFPSSPFKDMKDSFRALMPMNVAYESPVGGNDRLRERSLRCSSK